MQYFLWIFGCVSKVSFNIERRLEVFCKLIFTTWNPLQNIFSFPRILENIVQDEEKFAENRIENVLFWLEKSAFLFFFPRNMTHFKKN